MMGSRPRSSGTLSLDSHSDRSSEHSRSIHSFTSGKKKFSYHDKTRQKWDNSWEFIFVCICSTLPMEMFDYFFKYGKSTTFHLLISFLVVGMPMVYLQIVLGQFTQLGITRIKFICPLAHGLGYTFVIATIVRTVRHTYFMSDALIYFMSSFQSHLQWAMCPPQNKTNCWESWQPPDCKKECLKDGTVLSAYIYYTRVYLTLTDEELGEYHLKYGWPTVSRFFMLLLVCVLLFASLVYGIHQYRKFIVVNGVLALSGLSVLFFATLMSEGAVDGLANIFYFNIYSFSDLNCWMVACMDTVEILTIGRGIYTLHGSQLQINAPSGVLTIVCVSLSYIISCFASFLMHTSIGIIMKHAYMSEITTKAMFKICHGFPFTTTIFSVIPQGLSYLPVTQFWTAMYFAVLVAVGLNNQITNILLIEKSVTDSFPRMVRYRNYTLGAICCALFVVTLLTSCKDMFMLSAYIFKLNAKIYEVINTLLLSVIVFWIYRVIKLSDDIHFFMGSQPTKFWKFCWWIMPLIIVYPCYLYCYHLHVLEKGKILYMCLLVVMLSPLPVLLLYEIYQHLKGHNLIGLFNSQERWGPADPEERQIRRLFNPRQEIRSRRRNETCVHKCLIMNRTIRNIVEEEEKTTLEREESSSLYHESLYGSEENAGSDNELG